MEYKFRGKAIEDVKTSDEIIEKGDWVEGHYYFCRARETAIIVTIMRQECGGVGSGIVQIEVEASTETVGMWTGRKDVNNIDIYKDDILDLGQTVNGCSSFIVIWDNSRLGWNVEYNTLMVTPRNYEYDIVSFFDIFEPTNEGVAIVGNIHDNPELLERK